MKRLLFLAAALFALMSMETMTLQAQLLTPFEALDAEALAKAEADAKSSLAADAVLKLVGTGNVPIPVPGFENVKNGMNPANGRASFWGYIYFSPSLQRSTGVAIAKTIIGYVSQPVPADTFEFPVGPTPLDLTGQYANSSAMIQRLALDTAFIRFRTKFPDRYADVASLSQPDEPVIPELPTDQPIWFVSFSGAEDSSMFCVVASKSGETFCQRLEIPSSVPLDLEASRQALTVYPNPARGTTRIVVNAPAGTQAATGTGASLYNASGERVLDLSSSLANSGIQAIEFNAETLAPGTYFCVVQIGSWIGATRVIVDGR